MHEYDYINEPEQLLTPEVLADLMAEGFIEKVGNGRGSGYQVVAKD